jgi:hypothetical protein
MWLTVLHISDDPTTDRRWFVPVFAFKNETIFGQPLWLFEKMLKSANVSEVALEKPSVAHRRYHLMIVNGDVILIDQSLDLIAMSTGKAGRTSWSGQSV